MSWVFKTVQNQVLFTVCVLQLSLTWSFTNLILTTEVYLKQNKDIFRVLLSAVYLPLLKNGDLKEQKDPSFIRAKLNVPYTGKWSNRPDEFSLSLWKVRHFCSELSKLKYQPTDQAFDPGLVFTSALLISLIYYTTE